MEPERRAQYERLVEYLEEPVRDIVPAVWGLPFVKDTGFSCSGHILAGNGYGSPRTGSRLGWYPHRAMLELAFHPDEELTEEMREMRDAFRRDLASVAVGIQGLELGFKDAHPFPQDTLPYSRIPGKNISQNFNAHLPPEIEESGESIQVVERTLTALWEETASLLRRYNPDAAIKPIAGTNFRAVINWANWSSVFLRQG